MGWLIRNKQTIILYAVIVLLIITLGAAGYKLSVENKRNTELTSQNAELKKGNSEKEKELAEKDEQIKEKDKQIKSLKKKNKELLAAKKKKAAAAASAKNAAASSTAAPAPATSAEPAAAQQSELDSLIASMLIPRPVQNPLKNHTCYLTFDDGPSTNVTPRILETLKKHNVKATFFVVGTANLSLLPRISAEGHAIGLHSFTHDCYSQTSNNIYSSTKNYLLDLKSVSDAVASVTGLRPSIIRFPGGGSNLVSRKVCPGIMTNLTTLLQDMGYSYFDWNVSSGDADGKTHTPQELISFVVNNPHVQKNEGICVLMHDTNAKTTTADALDGIITELKNRGYRFETLAPGDFGFHQTVAN